MKNRILLIFFSLFVVSSACAQQDSLAEQCAVVPDTIVFCRPDSVLIVHSDSILSIVVNGNQGNPGYVYERSLAIADTSSTTMKSESIKQSNIFSFGYDGGLFDFGKVSRKKGAAINFSLLQSLEMGLTVPFSCPSGMQTRLFRSNEVRLNCLTLSVWPYKKKWGVSIDCGVSYNRYFMKKNAFTCDANHFVSITSMPEGVKEAESCMGFLRADLKVLYHYTVHREVDLAGGIMLSWCADKFGNTTSTVWRDADGKEQSELFKINPERVMTSFRLECLLCEVFRIYANVSPKSPFKSGTGPQFGTVSLGIGFRL